MAERPQLQAVLATRDARTRLRLYAAAYEDWLTGMLASALPGLKPRASSAL
ncbi:hypothetical protein [Streptomyces sp. NBC_00209]|uniref:hypothetical protein n=1 Tax=Streptomyces sp. NBC_00209 TaxID=2975682 RepID=UPI003246D8FE